MPGFDLAATNPYSLTDAPPGQPACDDYEYERHDTANLFMLYALGKSWRHVKVTDRRRRQDCAHVLWDLADVHFPGKTTVLVIDNLNIYKLLTLYATFDPKEAARLLHRFRAHHTPKHGSWLNIAEIEINVLTNHCFKRCVPDRETMV